MASMRDTIGEKVEKLTAHHSALKERRHGYLVRPLTLIVGWLVVVGGIVTIPAPGPGWVTVFVGVGILSLELRWAQRLLEWGVARYDVFDDWFHRQSRGTRWVLVALLIVVIWVVFAAIAWAMWWFGLAGWLDPVAARLGLHR
ncbi:TIGR02611 family protein [Corynebacterium bovis]|uniref:TIGR02611 family protein n=1 Tax=Corynebacterium bovis TaxID=36808 RepID=UPI0031393506